MSLYAAAETGDLARVTLLVEQGVITTSLLLLLLVIDVIVLIYYYYTLVSNVMYCILLYISLGVMRLVS